MRNLAFVLWLLLWWPSLNLTDLLDSLNRHVVGEKTSEGGTSLAIAIYFAVACLLYEPSR